MLLPALTPNRTLEVPSVGVDIEPSSAMRKRVVCEPIAAAPVANEIPLCLNS
jgi:hypothetical protein